MRQFLTPCSFSFSGGLTLGGNVFSGSQHAAELPLSACPRRAGLDGGRSVGQICFMQVAGLPYPVQAAVLLALPFPKGKHRPRARPLAGK